MGEDQRMFIILECLEGGHGVSLSILDKVDLSFLAGKYDGKLYLCIMGGLPAVRLKL